MQSGQFPKASFAQALTVTKKIKSNMKPFIDQFSQNNIQWLFQSITILFHNLTQPGVDPLIKMNSMFAIKCIIDSCEYVPIALIETYILPIIRIGAFTDLQVKDDRGSRFFGEGEDQLGSYGYNYVLLCTELVKVLSVIKPHALHYVDETEDASQFARANAQLNKQLKHPPESLKFFKEKPDDLHKIYANNLEKFDGSNEKYLQFIRKALQKQLKSGFKNDKGSLDIRELLKSGDLFILDEALQMVGQFLLSQKFACPTYIEAIKFISEIVRTGNISACLFMQDNLAIKNFVKEVIKIPNESKALSRGADFLPKINGTPEEKKQLYQQFLRNLEYWASTFPKDALKPPNTPSNVAKYYKILKNDYKFEFPNNPLLDNLIKETQLNSKRRKNRNQIVRSQIMESQEFKPQEEDSVILGALKKESTKSIKPEEPRKSEQSIKHQEPIKKNEHLEGNVTPGGGKDQTEECRQKLKLCETTLNLLTQNETNLPKNIKIIEDNLAHVNHFMENNNLDENVIEQLMTSWVDIDEKMTAIKPVYKDYKAGTIDYRKFCKTLRPQASQKNIMKEPNVSHSSVRSPPPDLELKQQSRKELPPVESIKQLKRESTAKFPQRPPSDRASQQIIQSNINQSYQSSKGLVQPPIASKKFLQQPLKDSAIRQGEERVSFNQSRMSESKLRGSRIEDNSHHYEINPITNVINQSKTHGHNIQASPFKNFQAQEVHYQPVTNNNGYRRSSSNFNGRSPIVQAQASGEYVTYTQNNFGSIGNQNTAPDRNGNSIQPNQQGFSQSRKIPGHQQLDQIVQYEDGNIQNPSLSPLDHSFHDLQEIHNESIKTKTFRDAISNERLFIKTNKKQNLFKLGQQCTNLIKPVAGTNKKNSKITSSINVPQLLDERKKKYEAEMKLLEQNKDKEIKELKSRLVDIEQEKKVYYQELIAKEDEIRSLRENSEAGMGKSRAQSDAKTMNHFNFIDDHDFLIRQKIQHANIALNAKKGSDTAKNKSRMFATGALIDSKPLYQYFKDIKDQKTKKIFMKNKELLCKIEGQIQIGYIGQLNGSVYTITVFITPEKSIKILNVTVEDNYGQQKNELETQVNHDLHEGTQIEAKKQIRSTFRVSYRKIPYKIPYVNIVYEEISNFVMENGQKKQVGFFLPCALHKFLPIYGTRDEAEFNAALGEEDVIRGEQIPYSRKILKNIELLKDFLPDIHKLNRGEPNERGQICFGGSVENKTINFLIKISIKPNQFLYLQAKPIKNNKSMSDIHFYIATVNYFLMKDVAWN